MNLKQFASLIEEPKPKSPPRKALEHHVTGAIERGEREPIVEKAATKAVAVAEIMPPETLVDAELDRDSGTETVMVWATTHTTGIVMQDRAWVWLTYPSKPAREELDRLKANGFRWARKRKQWYHTGGTR